MARRNRKVQSQVESLLERFHMTIPPVDVASIAEQLHVELQKADLGEISGLVFQEKGKVIIGVNSKHSANRQRFTIAHELGHFFLHAQNPLYVDKVFALKLRDHVSSEAIDIDEIEANAFAAELLMPTKMILNDIQNISTILDSETGDLDDLAKKLSEKYAVSKQAMAIRLINIGLVQNSF